MDGELTCSFDGLFVSSWRIRKDEWAHHRDELKVIADVHVEDAAKPVLAFYYRNWDSSYCQSGIYWAVYQITCSSVFNSARRSVPSSEIITNASPINYDQN